MIIACLFVIALFGIGLGLIAHGLSSGHADRQQKLHRALLGADSLLEQESRLAKRRMNDAAGQSWRNLAG